MSFPSPQGDILDNRFGSQIPGACAVRNNNNGPFIAINDGDTIFASVAISCCERCGFHECHTSLVGWLAESKQFGTNGVTYTFKFQGKTNQISMMKVHPAPFGEIISMAFG